MPPKPCKEHTQKSRRYGMCKYQGQQMGFHKREWIKVNGPIPDGMLVLHTCDNMPCYEITHLYLGTYSDNAKDRFDRGRDDQRGEKNHYACLTTKDVAEIRASYPQVTQKALAAQYGVHQTTISRIVNGRRWA